jgi:small-conductance mechanosensitive channel
MNFIELFRTSFHNFFNAAAARIPSILAALVVLLIFIILASLVRRIMDGDSSARTRVRQLYARLIQTGLIIVGLLLGFSIMGVNLTGLLTGLGLVTVGISFSLQDVLVNFVAGLQLLGQASFEIGETIEVAGEQGTVREIGARAVILEAENGTRISIPNRDLLVKTLKTNKSIRGDWLTLDFETSSAISIPKLVEKVRKTISDMPGVRADTTSITTVSLANKIVRMRVVCRLEKSHAPRAILHSDGLSRIAAVLAELSA